MTILNYVKDDVNLIFQLEKGHLGQGRQGAYDIRQLDF